MWVLVAAGATALVIGMVLAGSALVRADRRSRREASMADVAEALATASRRLAQALDRVDGIRAGGELRAVRGELTVARTAEAVLVGVLERTGADAAALTVESLSGAPVTAYRGDGVDAAVLESTLAATGGGSYRAATVRWSYGPPGGVAGRFRTATVVPVLEDDRVTGWLVAYASSDTALGPAQERELRALADELSTLLETARRYDRLELRYLRDPDTGIRNREAYEMDLEREIAKARNGHAPLTVVLVEIEVSAEDRRDDGTSPHVVALARAATDAFRASDALFRRRSHQLALLLPGTDGVGAGTVAARLQAEALAALAGARGTLALGAVEWRPGESADSLDARATAALEDALRTPLAKATDALGAS